MKSMKSVRGVFSALLVVALVAATVPGSGFALNGTASYAPAESNIAVKYWVSATSDVGEAGNAIDGDVATAWAAPQAPATLTVDLGGAYDAVHKVELLFADNKKAYAYILKGSADGDEWATLADRSANAKKGGIFSDLFDYAGLRYVSLTVLGGAPAEVKELRVINYLRPDMDNGSDTSEQGTNTSAYYYNAGNNPPAEGFRGGRFSDPGSVESGNNFYGLTKDMGWDTIRLRIWNEPKSEGSNSQTAALGAMPAATTSCSPAVTRTHAKRVMGAGQRLAIDFHYADSWSDPQNQPKPYAWANLPFQSADPETNDLVKQTYQFTYEMIKSLIDQGTAPSIVALGNEITNGMMWGSEYDLVNPYRDFHDYYRRFIRNNPDAPRGGGVMWMKYEEADGDASSAAYAEFRDSIVRLAKLVDAGNRAISALNDEYELDIETELHFAFNVFEGSPKVAMNPDKVFAKVITLISNLTDDIKGMDGGMVDRIGISYYPDWHGDYATVQKNIVEIAKLLPEVKFNIAECSPKASGTVNNWMENPNRPVGFRYTVQSQGDDTIDTMKLINDVPNNVGMGVWPWNGTGVYGSGTGNNGTLNASFKAWNDAFAKNVLENKVFAATAVGTAPALPATVKSLDPATGIVSDVPVTWAQGEPLDPSLYAQEGVLTVKGVAAVAVPSTGRGAAMTEVTATVDVNKVKIETPVKLNLKLKKPYKLPFDAYGADCQFMSSNPNVATVSADGTVNPLRLGVAILTLKTSDGLNVSSVMLNVTT